MILRWIAGIPGPGFQAHGHAAPDLLKKQFPLWGAFARLQVALRSLRMNPFKSIVLSLQAAGTSAVVCVWLICLTVLALFAPESATTNSVVMVLTIFGGAVISAMAFRRD
jgi:hypothetical protein